jgi:hypothetical protein
MTHLRLADFSPQLQTLIDKAQRLRDEINRSIIASTSSPSDHTRRRRRVARPR